MPPPQKHLAPAGTAPGTTAHDDLRPRRVVALVLATLAVFQAGLAGGAPWGAAAYGGQRTGRLPSGLRTVSGVAAIVYAGGAASVLAGRGSPAARRRGLGVVAAVTGVGSVVNTVSRSPVERVWGPVCVVGLAAALRARRALVPGERS